MLKHGAVVYFKDAKLSGKRTAPNYGFKGHGVGVFLGSLPPFAKDINVGTLNIMLGSIGLVSFDDVNEMVGEEIAKDLIKKFEAKYYPPQPIKPESNLILPPQVADTEVTK
jgi:hypothetical protein